MNSHDASAHESRLRELLQQSDPERSFEKSELADCRTCQEEFTAMHQLQAFLNEIGEDERRSIEGSRDKGNSPRDELAIQRLRHEIGPDRPSRTWGARGVGRKVAVAAIIAVLGVILWQRSAPPHPDPGPLLGPESSLWPSGTVSAVREFRWDKPLPRGGWFVVKAYENQPGISKPFLESEELRDQTWRAPSGITWPQEFFWELEVYDGSSGSFPTQVLRQSVSLTPSVEE